MKVLTKAVLGLFLASLLGGTAWAQGRVATIDLTAVFNRYWKTQESKTMLDDQRAMMEKDLSKLSDDFKKLNEDYQALLAKVSASDPAISQEQRDKNKQAAEDKLKEIKNLQDTADRERTRDLTTLNEQAQRTSNKIIEEIKTSASAKAKEANYSMVIDISAQSMMRTPFGTTAQAPIVLYTSGGNDDLTDKVVEDLNRTHSSSTPTTGEKQPAKK